MSTVRSVIIMEQLNYLAHSIKHKNFIARQLRTIFKAGDGRVVHDGSTSALAQGADGSLEAAYTTADVGLEQFVHVILGGLVQPRYFT